MNISANEAAKLMVEVTGYFMDDVFDLGGVGLLMVVATGEGNAADGCATTSYEVLDELDADEWKKENGFITSITTQHTGRY